MRSPFSLRWRRTRGGGKEAKNVEKKNKKKNVTTTTTTTKQQKEQEEVPSPFNTVYAGSGVYWKIGPIEKCLIHPWGHGASTFAWRQYSDWFISFCFNRLKKKVYVPLAVVFCYGVCSLVKQLHSNYQLEVNQDLFIAAYKRGELKFRVLTLLFFPTKHLHRKYNGYFLADLMNCCFTKDKSSERITSFVSCSISSPIKTGFFHDCFYFCVIAVVLYECGFQRKPFDR